MSFDKKSSFKNILYDNAKIINIIIKVAKIILANKCMFL